MSEALVKVEVDIFSGVSNPCQSINFDLLLEKSKCLYVAHEIAPQPPPLGYRGLIIHFPPESGGRTRYHLSRNERSITESTSLRGWLTDGNKVFFRKKRSVAFTLSENIVECRLQRLPHKASRTTCARAYFNYKLSALFLWLFLLDMQRAEDFPA